MILEFFLEDNDAVDSKYEAFTRHGYHRRLAPIQTFGPYAAIDDPDGNVVLLTAG